MKYIKDEGKVRYCASNISKMNVFECIYYSIFHWGYFQHSIYKVLKHLLKLIEITLDLGLEIIKFIMFPFFIVIHSILIIRSNKKWIEKIR